MTGSGVVVPKPALAYFRGGVVFVGPGFFPFFYPPPIVVAPPVYYAPPPVYYPPPVAYSSPPVVYSAPAAPYPVIARSCVTPALICPMQVPRTPGTACFCSGSTGVRSNGIAR